MIAVRILVRAAAVLMALTSTLAAAQSPTVDVDGVKFRQSIELAGGNLVLNGVGIRTRLMFKVYAAGLYLPERNADPTAILRQSGAKRVALRFLREVDADLFVASLLDGLRNNLSAQEVERLRPRTEVLVNTLRSIGSVRRGEWVDFEFTPRDGTRLILNGTTHGANIPGEDFFLAVLAVWLGDKPAHEDLKRGMLGTLQRG